MSGCKLGKKSTAVGSLTGLPILTSATRFSYSDTESASFSVFCRLCLKFQIGTSLESLDEDSLLYFQQTNGLKRDRAACTIKCMRQTFVNLLGRENLGNPTHFAGGSLTEENLESFRNDPFCAAGVLNYHGALLTYFGEHVRHADMVVKAGHDYLQKTHIASSVIMWDTLFLREYPVLQLHEKQGKENIRSWRRFFDPRSRRGWLWAILM
jgi:hypothetical protein